MSLLDDVKPKDAVAALDELKNSLGWKLIEATLDTDMIKAVEGMGTDPNMTEAQMHYRRGGIHATKNFKTVPDQLIMQFSNSLTMEEAMGSAAKNN